MNNSDGIYVEVSILNKTWTFRGFDAIRDLAEWMDCHASDSHAPGPYQDNVAVEATTALAPEPTARVNYE